jgi:hypothetical protein
MTIKKLQDGRLADGETGELITKAEAEDIIHEEALSNTDEKNKELFDLGLRPNITTKITRLRGQDYTTVKIKKGFVFNKAFREGLKCVIKNDGLSKNARCIIGTLIGFVTFPTNAIKVDGKYPEVDDLLDLTGMSQATYKDTLNELESHEVLKRVRDGHLSVIYFNPFLVCGGSIVALETYLLFKDSVYNPHNV